jgi:hypothetical protein
MRGVNDSALGPRSSGLITNINKDLMVEFMGLEIKFLWRLIDNEKFC